jgi:hypothetical protein
MLHVHDRSTADTKDKVRSVRKWSGVEGSAAGDAGKERDQRGMRQGCGIRSRELAQGLEAFWWQWASRFDSHRAGCDACGSVPGASECVRAKGPNGPNVAQLLREGSMAMQALRRGPE